ncbi:hypothetical protein [Streptomyces sp. 8N616]|uniref:hypothetical protein n=1 Tax=Streptomyces sp. 8N616 TaxID=3457414 RepID=UPI003FD65136
MEPAASADPYALVLRWAERHGVDAARHLAEAEDLADAVAKEITPDNTVDTYAKSWRGWERFCAATGLPVTEGSRGAQVAYATWMLREGRQDGTGYAPQPPRPICPRPPSGCAACRPTSRRPFGQVTPGDAGANL